MDTVNLYMLQIQSRLLSSLETDTTTCRRLNNDADTQSGTVSFSDLLNACLEGNGASAVSGVTADSGVSAINGTNNATAGSLQISNAGVQFIADHEGYSASAYRGADAQNLTIGYGHVITSGENYTSLTKAQALSLLKKDLSTYEASVNREFSGTKLTQSQFDALVSFSYNLGGNIWSKVPLLTSDIKSGASSDVLQADFTRVSNCNGRRLQGLVNRRLDEFRLFESDVQA